MLSILVVSTLYSMKNRFTLTLQPSANVAMTAIASNLQGCKCFANLETKLCTKIPTSLLVQMKGNLSQIYHIRACSLSQKRIVLVKLIYMPICL